MNKLLVLKLADLFLDEAKVLLGKAEVALKKDQVGAATKYSQTASTMYSLGIVIGKFSKHIP